MSSDSQTSDSSLVEVATLLGAPDSSALAKMGMEALRRRTQRQLAEASRLLGIGGVSRWTKDALAGRLLEELPRLVRAGAPEVTKAKAKLVEPSEKTSDKTSAKPV